MNTLVTSLAILGGQLDHLLIPYINGVQHKVHGTEFIGNVSIALTAASTYKYSPNIPLSSSNNIISVCASYYGQVRAMSLVFPSSKSYCKSFCSFLYLRLFLFLLHLFFPPHFLVSPFFFALLSSFSSSLYFYNFYSITLRSRFTLFLLLLPFLLILLFLLVLLCSSLIFLFFYFSFYFFSTPQSAQKGHCIAITASRVKE